MVKKSQAWLLWVFDTALLPVGERHGHLWGWAQRLKNGFPSQVSTHSLSSGFSVNTQCAGKAFVEMGFWKIYAENFSY